METAENTPNSENFDVLSFLEGTNYPTSEVVVFQDAKSADEYVRLVNGPETPDQEKVAELEEKIRKSAIVFELRGMPPGFIQDIMDKHVNDKGEFKDSKSERAFEDELIAGNIIAVRNADGGRDERVFKGEDIATFRRFLKEGEFGKLVEEVVKINFNAAVFDQATDAGFSGRLTDLA